MVADFFVVIVLVSLAFLLYILDHGYKHKMIGFILAAAISVAATAATIYTIVMVYDTNPPHATR